MKKKKGNKIGKSLKEILLGYFSDISMKIVRVLISRWDFKAKVCGFVLCSNVIVSFVTSAR
jgi:hypothetical protein